MNFKLFWGVFVTLLFIDVTSSQRHGILHYLRSLLAQQTRPTRTIQIRRTPQVITSSAGGLAGIGVGGVLGAGGLLGGTFGVQQPQTITLQRNSRPTLFTTNPSEDAIKRAALGLGASVQSVDFGSIDSGSSEARIGPGGSRVIVDRPDRPDPIDVVYAPRSMVSNPRDVARLQRLTDSDAVMLV